MTGDDSDGRVIRTESRLEAVGRQHKGIKRGFGKFGIGGKRG